LVFEKAVESFPAQNSDKKMMKEMRTTSHWAYPVKVNGLQPQTYGKKDLMINYHELKPPDLQDLMSEIFKIL